MADSHAGESRILATYRARTRRAAELYRKARETMLGKLRLAMLNNGVDLKGWRGGILSAAHTQADVDLTLDAWRKSLRALKEEGELADTKGKAVAV